MNRERRKRVCISAGLLAAFVLWTALVCRVDVQPIGPMGVSVGFGTVNRWFHDVTGVHMTLYTLTDWLSLIPATIVLGFALLGLSQWGRRKSLRKVDRSLLILGGFYGMVMSVYLFFEAAAVNCRPVLIEGVLEASYPSSTTTLVLCVMPTAAMQLRGRIRNRALSRCILPGIAVFTALMVLARLLSGVHWLTDIVGGVLLSAGLVTLYGALTETKEK